ncbi:helix-turn-helix domain-containing protein [Aliarcobacter lanthieri]|uniref:helix-turn-helix domain-containing protein n=1 Tax=Aliarcobacter lanthieri TaxID=1355374 RepID=UPI00047D0B1B|nr:helix-turn-helix transcriptional regulator [Aliarcobacter lanthieri]
MNNKEIELLNKLANKIKSTRLQLNLSQETLADKCGLDRTYISLVERSKRNPSYLSLVKLCDGLEINIKELLGE